MPLRHHRRNFILCFHEKTLLLVMITQKLLKKFLDHAQCGKEEMSMLRAWIIWLLSALFMCYKYAIEVSPSVMTADLMSAFSLNGTQMGNLAAAYFYAYLLMQIPAGLLIDR